METLLTRREARDGGALAKGLGVFSVGLGIAELAAPHAVARLIGVDEVRRAPVTLRVLGAREVASGLGVLASPRAAQLARVVGDAVDLALLGWALRSRCSRAERIGVAVASVLGVTVLDVIAARRLARARRAAPVIRTTTINRTPAEVYAHFRDLESLPEVMSYLESVTELDDKRSRWIAKLPTGNTIAWSAEIIDDIPGQRLEWRATGGVDLHGTVTFAPAPGARGTEIRVAFQLGRGRLGEALGRLIVGPQLEGDLRRFKQLLETGEVMKSDASIHRGPHPSHPDEEGARA